MNYMKNFVCPEYYKDKDGIIEAGDFIEAFELDFNLGNVVKYIVRAGKKKGESKIQALWKAQSYLLREIIKIGNAEIDSQCVKNCKGVKCPKQK